jgi:polyvinyl alcohol dehydrogenase (cytochrome)
LVIAGQSRNARAFDPDNGSVVWKQDFGSGSPLGGIHWGIAFDGERVYAPINRPYGGRPEVATQSPVCMQ